MTLAGWLRFTGGGTSGASVKTALRDDDGAALDLALMVLLFFSTLVAGDAWATRAD
jgi:hypothetical protein